MQGILFQFLLGTIGSLCRRYEIEQDKKFQFLLGTIGSYESSNHDLGYIISIPFRYDWEILDYSCSHL